VSKKGILGLRKGIMHGRGLHVACNLKQELDNVGVKGDLIFIDEKKASQSGIEGFSLPYKVANYAIRL
jgi:hypothetical protein